MFGLTKYQPRRSWTPVSGFRTMQEEMDRLFDNFFAPGLAATCAESAWCPSVDVFEDDDKFTLRAEVPGMSDKDIQISVQDNTISIRGEKKEEKEEKDIHYHKLERVYGNFCRSFQLPANVEEEKISAHYKDGILEVMLPKTAQTKAKSIEIKVD